MKHKHLSPAAWAAIVDAYELGLASGAALARPHGVSRQAISAGLKKRGAVKGRRVSETIAPLVQQLDQHRREREKQEQAKWEQAGRRRQEVGRMMAALVKADAAGVSLCRWQEYL